MNAILTIAWKDIILTLRDKGGLFWRFVFPLLYAVVFGFLMSSPGGRSGISLVLVDEDGTDRSKAFAATLTKAPELAAVAGTRDEALDLVRRGKKTAFLVIPKGYGESRQRMFGGNQPEFELGVDPARTAEAGMLQGILTKYSFQQMQSMFTDYGAMRSQIKGDIADVAASDDMEPRDREVLSSFLGQLDLLMARMEEEDKKPEAEKKDSSLLNSSGMKEGFSPVRFKNVDIAVKKEGPRSAFEITFPQGIIWAILGSVSAFAVALVNERMRGTLVRMQMAPITRAHVLGGTALGGFAMMTASAAVLLLVGRLFLDIHTTSPLLMAMAVASSSIAFVGLTMLLATFGKTEASVGGAAWGVLIVMAMFGGGMIPLFFMPPFMQTLSVASPVRWTILAVEGALWRGFTFWEMLVPCGVLVATGVVCFALGAKLFRWND